MTLTRDRIEKLVANAESRDDRLCDAALALLDDRDSLRAALEKATAERDEATEGECARAVERDAALAQVSALREALEETVHALLVLSPWKLQDCWCDEPGRGGKDAHRGPCLKARWTLKGLRSALRDTAATAKAFEKRVWDEGVSAAWHRATEDIKLGFGTVVGQPFTLALAEHDARVRAATLEEASASEMGTAAFLSHIIETRHCSPVSGVTQEQFLACVAKLRALATPPGPTAEQAALSKRIADAMEKSKPLVRDALKLGRSIAGAGPTLGVIGAPARQDGDE